MPDQPSTTRYPLDVDRLEKLSDPNSPEAIRAAAFKEAYGTAGYLAMFKAIQEDHIDGIIGLINSDGSPSKNQIEDVLTKLAVATLYGITSGGVLLFGESEYSDTVVYLFTREQHIEDCLAQYFESERPQPIAITLKDVILACQNNQFGVHLNPLNGIFEIELPPALVDVACNYAVHGKDKIQSISRELGRPIEGRI